MTGEGQMKCRAVENPRAGFIQVRSSREEQILLLFELVWAQQGVFDSFCAATVRAAGSLQRVWRLLIPDGDAKAPWVRRSRTCVPFSCLNLGGVLTALPKSVPRTVAKFVG